LDGYSTTLAYGFPPFGLRLVHVTNGEPGDGENVLDPERGAALGSVVAVQEPLAVLDEIGSIGAEPIVSVHIIHRGGGDSFR